MSITNCKHPDGCARQARKMGWCSMHYNRIRESGSPGPTQARAKRRPGEPGPCAVEGCTFGPARAKGLCDVHYQRIRAHGDLGPPELARRRLPAEVREWTPGQRHRFYKYGLTPEAFDALLEGQHGRCYVCGTKEPGGMGWSVDHCHESGAVRFIACNPCNTALGFIKEDPAIAKRLYEVALECRQIRLAV